MDRQQTPVESMRVALDLYGLAESMMRQNILRERPEATAEEIEEEIRRWLSRPQEPLRPGQGFELGSIG